MNLDDYDIIEVPDASFVPKIGDIVYYRRSDTVELIVDHDTDLLQEEFYPMLLNFGCILLRKKKPALV
jgi:hypothetical protein